MFVRFVLLLYGIPMTSRVLAEPERLKKTVTTTTDQNAIQHRNVEWERGMWSVDYAGNPIPYIFGRDAGLSDREMASILNLFLVLSFTLNGKCVEEVGFTEVPYSLMVTPGTRATFRCRHETADVIGWRVNGTSVGQVGNPDFIPGTIRREDGSLVHILTVVVSPEYNDTEIVCVAAFIHQELPLELTPVVTLIVFEGCNETCLYEGFVEVPQTIVAPVGTVATFNCRHISTDTISWIVNGTSLDELHLPNITTMSDSESFLDGGVTHSLIIYALALYSGIDIRCSAYVQLQPYQTLPAVLLIQGLLSSVSGVYRKELANQNAISYFWEPPPSLDLTGVEPDIVYCVEVYNITCGADNLIASECDLTNPVYPANVGEGLDSNFVYNITVVPRSNVPGAANGAVFTKQEEFMSVEVFPKAIMENSAGVQIEFGVSMSDTEAERLMKAHARWFSLNIDSSQVSISEVICENDDNVTVVLPKSQIWRDRVFAYGCQQHPVTSTMEISTHSVQNISVRSNKPGELAVTGDFITNTSALGMLAIVYSTVNDSDIHYTEARLPQTEISLTGLSGNAYSVSAFVIENTGLPFNRVATSPKEIAINRGNVLTQTEASVEYAVQEIPSCVRVTCTFLDSSTTDCVAVVHQRISQLSSSGLMNIESSHKFTRSGDTAYGCIEGVNLTDSQVGVIGAQLGTNQENLMTSNHQLIAGLVFLVFGSVLLLISIVIWISLIRCRFCSFKKKKMLKKTANTINLKNLNNEPRLDLELQSYNSPHQSTTMIEAHNYCLEGSDSGTASISSDDEMDENYSSTEVPPKTESSDGYKGSTALALPLDNVTCTCRPSTQPLPALKRNLPHVERDIHPIMSSLRQHEAQASSLLYERDEISNVSIAPAEVTETHPTQVTDARIPSKYMYIHLHSKLAQEEVDKHHNTLSGSSSSEICVAGMTTAKLEGGKLYLGGQTYSSNMLEENVGSDDGFKKSVSTINL